ncbi:MAG TPA: gamma-glutamyl-gamma-aminobutyrate hydrolase family protein [Pseudogracilibacillus sp.]|nr:gamma-glutamyl-gamma-aminobutyrate hydrolase family protein [Pseudogracilibacillus sp.]
MKPIIGITAALDQAGKSFTVHRAHGEAIALAGGLGVVLPYMEEQAALQIANKIDGLYLTGGDDIDPHYFNEEAHVNLAWIDPERDAFELSLFREMLRLNKPILGVCRGSQIINVGLGGSMYQDLASQKSGSLLQHRQKRSLRYGAHFIDVLPSTRLFQITKEQRIKVNSNHHQANARLGEGIRIAAISADGVIEAIEGVGDLFVLGVQWHPERMPMQENTVSRLIYQAFIAATKKRK